MSGMEKIKVALGSIFVLMLATVAILVGVFLALGLAVIGTVGALVLRYRMSKLAQKTSGPVVIEGEFTKI